MAFGMRCETCGAQAPSLGSLQMHQLRYHSASPAPAGAAAPGAGAAEATNPAPGPAGRGPVRATERKPSRTGNGRSGAIAPLALAIVALLSGGAFAATRPRPADAFTPAELQAAVHRALPTTGDLPAGWTVDPPDPSDTDPDGDGRELAECVGAIYEDTPTEAEAAFSSGAWNITADFNFASSVERARADFAALAGPAAPGCFEQMMRTVLDADKPAGGTYDIEVTPSDLAAGLRRDADHDAIGFRIVANLHGAEASVPVTFEVVMVRYDRVESTLAFTAVGSPGFPSDVARSLTGAVVHRLADPS